MTSGHCATSLACRCILKAAQASGKGLLLCAQSSSVQDKLHKNWLEERSLENHPCIHCSCRPIVWCNASSMLTTNQQRG